jgi:hypothetical protein
MGLRGAVAVAALAAVFTSGDASAGPPYVTDDPETTDVGHWEIYDYVQGTQLSGGAQGQAGVDVNYGLVKNLQLDVVIPADFQSPDVGFGDVQLAIKYRFLHQDEHGWMPDVSFYPRLFAPTADRRFGSGRPDLFLPIWAQKDWGPWSLFGGGGYEINPGPGNRNFWLNGLALTRTVTDRLSLGLEVYHQTPDTVSDKAFTGVNFGATYKLTDHWSLVGAGGPGVQNARQQDQYDFYLALEATY